MTKTFQIDPNGFLAALRDAFLDARERFRAKLERRQEPEPNPPSLRGHGSTSTPGRSFLSSERAAG